jgi:hypothetical protein
MDAIHIICKLNEDDNFSIQQDSLAVNLTNKSHYHFTFWDTRKNKDLLRLPNFFSNEGLDILYLSLFVFYADRRIQREMFPDAWTRKIRLYVPVLSIEKWSKEKSLVEKLLSFLSGDIWSIEFRQRELNETELKFQKRISAQKEKRLDIKKICMLSGGLDSFVGAIDLLEISNDTTFIGHYGGGKGVASYQDLVKTILKNEYGLTEYNFFNFHAAPLNGVEDTTRTRSFMFFAHAIVLASAIRRDLKLIVPENGLISLNIPLTNSRLGSSSTRTTHPFYMGLLQELLKNLEIQVEFENPYQFKTKGEMIAECTNKGLLQKNLINTMSCSHPDNGRYQGESNSSHCGTCLPCIIRRASIKKANIQDTSLYRDSNFASGKTASNNLRAYRIAIRKYENTSPAKNYFRIQMSGPLYDDLSEYKSLYQRGMQELIDLLEEVDE